MLNDRQFALLLWAGLVLVALLVWPTGRRSLADVARLFLSRKIWPVFALLALWSLGLVLIGERIGIWTDALTADTWFWFFTTAVVVLFNFSKASKEPDFFKRTAKETFGFTLIFGFLSDLYVLSVPVEFVGQGIVAVLAGVSAVAAHQRDSAEARKLADGCLSVVGLTILALALLSLVTNWSNEDAPDLTRQLLMPAWMTLVVLPYIYAVALYAVYEMAFIVDRLPQHRQLQSSPRRKGRRGRAPSWSGHARGQVQPPLGYARCRGRFVPCGARRRRRVRAGTGAAGKDEAGSCRTTHPLRRHPRSRRRRPATRPAGVRRDHEDSALDRDLPDGLGSPRDGLPSRHPGRPRRPQLTRSSGRG